MGSEKQVSGFVRLGRALLVGAFSVVLSLCFFLVLPLLQAISQRPAADLELRAVSTTELPPPPPPVEEPEEEEPEEAPPPNLADEAPPLDLSQLELALNPGFGDGLGGDFAIELNSLMSGGGAAMEELFSANVDQKPRPVFQQAPTVTSAMKKRMPGGVNILLTVDANGRVANAMIESSTDPVFEAPALAAIKQWKFEAGKRGGKPASFRIRQPMTFK